MQSAERAQQLVGTILSERYRLTAVLTEHGSGATLAAEHVHMRHRVAVKVLYPEAAQRRELLVAFEREALAGAHVEHDGVAGATDYGALPDGLRFLVMEYLEGPTLRELLARGPVDVRRALRIAAQIARALGSMHARGIVHRALSADSVRLVERGGEVDVVKVVDFGSALLPSALIAEEADARRQDRVATPLHPSGSAYGSPELLAGDPVDGRSDLYALGVLLFELILGAPPPARAYPVPSLRAVRGDVPVGLDELLARLLSPNPAERPIDAEEVGDALDELDRRGRAITSEQAKQQFASAPTAYGGQTPSPVSIRELPAVQSARTAEVSGGWVPLAQRDAIEPRRPVPRPIWLAGGGSLGIVFFITAIAALRDAPFPEGEAAAVAASTASGESSGGLLGGASEDPDEADADDDEERSGPGGGAKSAGQGSPGAPIISLGGLDILKGDPPLSTDESLRAFEELRNLRRMRKAQSAVAKLDELLKINPRAPEDKEVRSEMFELAQDVMVTNGPEAEQLYGWLASRIGHHGPDILYQLLTTKGGSRAAKRAERSLRDPKLQARFSEELRIAYGLRMGAECSEQAELIQAAGARGDRRAYGALYRVRELCDRRGQCCREHYEAVKAAIKAMEARGYR